METLNRHNCRVVIAMEALERCSHCVIRNGDLEYVH